MIKRNTPKLVAQAGAQKLRSVHDLSKAICVDGSDKRIFIQILTVPLYY